MITMPKWKWILSTLIILSGWIYCAALVSGILQALVHGTAPWQTLMRDLATFIPFFLITPLVWRMATGTSVAQLVNVRGRIDGRRIVLGFAAWFALSAASSVFDWFLHPADYRYTFLPRVFLPFLAVCIVLLPIQCWAEELFFRGWVLRWAARLPKASQAIISGVVFAAPHLGNPEAAQQTWLALTAWFTLGLGWAWVSARDGGIELALGAHLANNAFSLLIVGYDEGALPTAAVMTTSSINLAATVVALFVIVPVFARLTRPR